MNHCGECIHFGNGCCKVKGIEVKDIKECEEWEDE